MKVAQIPDRATKALLLARRRVMTGLAAPFTEGRIGGVERFAHPRARALAVALQRMRSGDRSHATPWIPKIEAERARLLESNAPLGAPGEAPGPYDAGLTVRDACLASRRKEDAIALFQLVHALEPERVLELGTNVGVSSAYMAAAQRETGRGSLVTLEASPGRARVAKELHAALSLTNVEYVLGLFDATLESALHEPVDFAFIDGHHQFEPTLDYFDRIWRHSREGAVFVFDDIRWSIGMERAWKRLQGDPRLVVVADLCGLGVAISTREPRATKRLVTKVLAI
ncbi:MAG TPA: class I SAM-dependent methyltransferase [Polyangiaceae bacterium]|nr:class I SAM-dependent methyltransferase [Polyangiaceae bacterium]